MVGERLNRLCRCVVLYPYRTSDMHGGYHSHLVMIVDSIPNMVIIHAFCDQQFAISYNV